MMKFLQTHRESSEWLAVANQKLIHLQTHAWEDLDDGDELPSKQDYENVRKEFEFIDKKAIPKLSAPDIWLSDSGGIGVVWKGKQLSLHLFFANGAFSAHVVEGLVQRTVSTDLIPCTLKQVVS